MKVGSKSGNFPKCIRKILVLLSQSFDSYVGKTRMNEYLGLARTGLANACCPGGNY